MSNPVKDYICKVGCEERYPDKSDISDLLIVIIVHDRVQSHVWLILDDLTDEDDHK